MQYSKAFKLAYFAQVQDVLQVTAINYMSPLTCEVVNHMYCYFTAHCQHPKCNVVTIKIPSLLSNCFMVH